MALLLASRYETAVQVYEHAVKLSWYFERLLDLLRSFDRSRLPEITASFFALSIASAVVPAPPPDLACQMPLNKRFEPAMFKRIRCIAKSLWALRRASTSSANHIVTIVGTVKDVEAMH
jgi:hypothetical protein